MKNFKISCLSIYFTFIILYSTSSEDIFLLSWFFHLLGKNFATQKILSNSFLSFSPHQIFLSNSFITIKKLNFGYTLNSSCSPIKLNRNPFISFSSSFYPSDFNWQPFNFLSINKSWFLQIYIGNRNKLQLNILHVTIR